MSINRVIISGNLTRDPELRQTAGGLPVLGFGVAVNDRRKNNQTGEWEDYPNFVDCTMFGTRAEAVSRFLAKGMKVAIDGRLRYSSWEKDGQRRSKLEVIVDEIEVMVRREGQTQAQPQQSLADTVPMQQQAQAAPQWSAQAAYAAATQPELYDEEVPF
ncbi:MAG: single-stranded DNA-binding protein [Eggerthellales bacterium]|nr:single-stranded DNA-binding protein [Eggerthellales bacterium]